VFSLSPVVVLSAPAFAAVPGPVSRPYLTAMTAPDMRFAEALPPPDLSVRPPAGAPPQPAATHETPVPSVPAPAGGESAALPPPVVSAESTLPAPGKKPAPPPILPDDTRPKVRPEDFLPFFKFPASAADSSDVIIAVPVTTTPPAPGTQLPSSASYRQQ